MEAPQQTRIEMNEIADPQRLVGLFTRTCVDYPLIRCWRICLFPRRISI